MKREHIHLRFDPLSKRFEMPIQNQRHSARDAIELFRSNASYLHVCGFRDFSNENLTELRIRFEQQKVIWSLYGEQSLNASLDFRERVSILAQVSEETCNQLIEGEFVVEWLVVSCAHV